MDKDTTSDKVVGIVIVLVVLIFISGYIYFDNIVPDTSRVDRFEDLLNMTTYSIHNTQIFDENMTFRKLRNSYYTLKDSPLAVGNYDITFRTDQMLDYVCDGGVSPVN